MRHQVFLATGSLRTRFPFHDSLRAFIWFQGFIAKMRAMGWVIDALEQPARGQTNVVLVKDGLPAVIANLAIADEGTTALPVTTPPSTVATTPLSPSVDIHTFN
jgi:hypothetical protein